MQVGPHNTGATSAAVRPTVILTINARLSVLIILHAY